MIKGIKKFFPIRLKKNEESEIIEFANIQGNFTDTVRYLIEKEIAENGIRNLQEVIPSVRDKVYFKNFDKDKKVKPKNINNNEKQTKESIETTINEEKKAAILEENKKADIKEIPNCYI